MAKWRWNFGRPGVDLSDIAGTINLRELPAPGGSIDHVFTVPFGGFIFPIWYTMPREPNTDDPDDWINVGAIPSMNLEVIVPNVNISFHGICQRVEHDGTFVDTYGDAMPDPPQILAAAQVYGFSSIAPTTHLPPFHKSQRLGILWFMTRNTNKGSLDVTIRLGNNSNTFLEGGMERTFPIMRNTAAAAALLVRRAQPALADSTAVMDIAQFNFADVLTESFPTYQNIFGSSGGLLYPGNGFLGVDQNLNGGWVSAFPDSRDRDNPLSPDERYDTFHFATAALRTFRLDVPNGVYDVRCVAGDPDFGQSDQNLTVNGVVYWAAASTGVNAYLDVTKEIRISAGKIELVIGGGASNSLLNWCLIQRRNSNRKASAVVVSSARGGLA